MSATHMSVADLARRWGCSREVLYRQIEAGRLKALHIGQAIRVPVTAVEQYERENTTGEPKPKARRRA